MPPQKRQMLTEAFSDKLWRKIMADPPQATYRWRVFAMLIVKPSDV
jgi:hypothetical protein